MLVTIFELDLQISGVTRRCTMELSFPKIEVDQRVHEIFNTKARKKVEAANHCHICKNTN